MFGKEYLKINIRQIKKYLSVASHSLLYLKYSVPKQISETFHNEFNYDYHFIIKH